MTDERANQYTEAEDSTKNAPEGAFDTPADAAPQYGVGPFSIREVSIVGVWILAFVFSFFSVAGQQAMAQLLFGGSVWTNGLDWILTIGLPTVAVFLIVLRRFSPDGIRRVGSLGVDQFASVAFSISALVWLGLLWRNVAVAIETGVWIYGWVVWVEFFLMLAGVVLTVLAPFIPGLAEDFTGRREVPAHRHARPIRPITARPPRPAAPANARPAETAAYGTDSDPTAVFGAGFADGQSDTMPVARRGADRTEDWEPVQTRDTFEPVDRSQAADEEAAAPAYQAFWALVPEERDVVDERDVPIFRIGPTAWALVLEDRGEVFVVRHEDGRIGYLHDVSDVTRG